MKSLAEIMRSNKRFECLGGKTLAENAIAWRGGPSTKREGPDVRLPEPYDFREHLGRCSVPPRIVEILAGAPEERAALVAARTWVEGDAAFLLLHGRSGGGKSVAAASVFRAARETVRWEGGSREQWDSHGCWFMGAPDLARLSYYSDDGRAVVAHAKRVRLLVLDDLGQENLSGPYLSTVDEILSDRFGDRRKRTVLTSNVSGARQRDGVTGRAKLDASGQPVVSDFEARYGERVARRIRESGQVVNVEKLVGSP